MVFHGLILLALLFQTAFSNNIQIRRFLLALALAPLTRLLSMMMPLQHFRVINWYLLVGVPLFLAVFYTARVGNVSREMLGLTARKLPFQALISLTGIGLGYLEYSILHPSPLVREFSIQQIWLPALILLIFTGLLEEIIFRGLLQSSAISILGQAGMIYMALVFVVMHLGYHSWVDLVFVFAVALFFGWVVRRSGSILGVTLAHGLTNISMFLIFPFLQTPMVIVTMPRLDLPNMAPARPWVTPWVIERTPTSASGIIHNTSAAAQTATPSTILAAPFSTPTFPAVMSTAADPDTTTPAATATVTATMTATATPTAASSPTLEVKPKAIPIISQPIPTRGAIRTRHRSLGLP